MGTDLQGEGTWRCFPVCSPAPVKSGVTHLCSQWPALEWWHSPVPLTPDTHLEIAKQQNVDVNTSQHERNLPHWLLLPWKAQNPKAWCPEQPLQQLMGQLLWLHTTAQLGPGHKPFQLHWEVLPFCLELLWEQENILAKLFLQYFCHMPIKNVRHYCVPGLGLGCDSVASLLERAQLLSLHFSFAMQTQPQVWNIWDQMISDTSPHTLLPQLGFTEGILGKCPLGVPCVPGVRGGLRGDGTVGVLQLCCGIHGTRGWGGTGLLGTLSGVHLEHTSLSFRKGIFKNYKNNGTV